MGGTLVQLQQLVLGYIDPATGAIVLQVILATILGIGVVFRRFFIYPIASIIGFFRGKKQSAETYEAEVDESR